MSSAQKRSFLYILKGKTVYTVVGRRMMIMDNKAFFDLVYGVCMLSTKYEDKINGCIINTCVQVANEPARLAISCINGNLTPELIKKSGIFTLSVLDSTVTFDVFKRFGLQSGRDVDKFEGIDHLLDEQGLPYLAEHADAMFSCKVVSSQDLGSHTLFIGEVLDAKVLSPEPPVTYGEYHSRIKPKPQTVEQKKIKGWKCSICGYEYEGETLPEDFMCPWCSHPASDFEPIYD